LVLVIFTVNVLFYGAILWWTGYSCQNKRQNALFWARMLKKFSGEGAQPPPEEGPTPIGKGAHPLPTLTPSARPIFANPPVIFFTILTLDSMHPYLHPLSISSFQPWQAHFSASILIIIIMYPDEDIIVHSVTDEETVDEIRRNGCAVCTHRHRSR